MILLTRPFQDAQRIAPDFENLGHDVLISPLLKIIHHDIAIPSCDALCLSSQNALPSVKDTHKKTPIYCVGTHTSNALKSLGFSEVISTPTAQELLKILRHETSFRRMLYLAGEISTLDFSKHLPCCHKIVCYDAIAQDAFSPEALAALQNNQMTYIPLYSMRSFEILIKLLMKNEIDLGRIIILALSQDIANQAQEFDFKEILIAKGPTHDSLLNLLIGYKNAP